LLFMRIEVPDIHGAPVGFVNELCTDRDSSCRRFLTNWDHLQINRSNAATGHVQVALAGGLLFIK
jgi:hypothetical protein